MQQILYEDVILGDVWYAPILDTMRRIRSQAISRSHRTRRPVRRLGGQRAVCLFPAPVTAGVRGAGAGTRASQPMSGSRSC
jgi:hypothetical protein